MRGFIIRRLLALIPTIILATMLVFFAVRMVPGDIIDQMLSQNDTGQMADRKALEQALGLDVPVHVQYVRWMNNVFLHGDLGRSLWKKTKVTDEIMARLPATLELSGMAIVFALLLAIPVGIYSARRQDTAGDYAWRSVAILGMAIPNFWLGTMVIIYPAIWWGWSPPLELISLKEDPLKNLQLFVLPALVLGFSLAGVTMRMMRAMMLEVLRQDYIRTAWAKGLPEKVIITRHALKNALIPVVTLIGLNLPIIIGGTVIVEQIFSIPGMGNLIYDAIMQRDYPIISGIMLFFASTVLICNLLVDLSYGFLDPKVRY